MERILILYSEFLENLEEYKNKYSDSRVHFNIEIKQKLY